MSDNIDKNEKNSEDESSPPMDDFGIKNDQILSLLDYAIEKYHDMYILNPKKNPKPQELRDMIIALSSAWNLVQNIIGIDDELRDAMEEMLDDMDKKSEDEEELDDEDETNEEDPE